MMDRNPHQQELQTPRKDVSWPKQKNNAIKIGAIANRKVSRKEKLPESQARLSLSRGENPLLGPKCLANGA